jgi:hypothetical protein
MLPCIVLAVRAMDYVLQCKDEKWLYLFPPAARASQVVPRPLFVHGVTLPARPWGFRPKDSARGQETKVTTLHGATFK